MNKKETESFIMECWFGIDKILFNKSAKSVLEGEDYKQYLTSKAALLSNLFEIFCHTGYSPESNHKNLTDILESGYKGAEISLSSAKDRIVKENVAKMVKTEIKQTSKDMNLTEEQVATYVVKKRISAIALDSLMLEDAAKNSCHMCFEDWKGKVLIDSHKVLRDSLIDASMK